MHQSIKQQVFFDIGAMFLSKSTHYNPGMPLLRAHVVLHYSWQLNVMQSQTRYFILHFAKFVSFPL